MFSISRGEKKLNERNAPKVVNSQNSSWENNELLWNAFRKGNESAFVEIYHQYFQLLYNYGRQINSDPESCKDVIQDLFIKLRKNRSKLPQVNSIKAFLLKSYRNKLYSEFKKKQRIETITYSNEAHNFLVSPSYETLLIDRQITKEQLERIKSAISTLSQRQREALHFFYYNNLSYEEIGEVMNFSSVKAARNLVYRALKEVKEKINNL